MTYQLTITRLTTGGANVRTFTIKAPNKEHAELLRDIYLRQGCSVVLEPVKGGAK